MTFYKHKKEPNSQKRFNILCYQADVDGLIDFLSQRASVDLDYDGGEPLILAIRSMVDLYPPPSAENCLRTCKVLVEYGANIHINEDFPLRYAMEKGVHIIVKYLLEIGDNFHLDQQKIDEYMEKNENLSADIIALFSRAENSSLRKRI